MSSPIRQVPTQIMTEIQKLALEVRPGRWSILVADRTGDASPGTIVLSPRNAERSAKLAAAHDVCSIAPDNQSVVDGADIIFVCVLPAQLDEVLTDLTFRPDQTLVSLVSTSTLAGLATCSKLPASQVYKMICLPPVAMHRGTCLLVPKGNVTIKTMCNSLGGTVECETEESLRALMVATCLMGPFCESACTHPTQNYAVIRDPSAAALLALLALALASAWNDLNGSLPCRIFVLLQTTS